MISPVGHAPQEKRWKPPQTRTTAFWAQLLLRARAIFHSRLIAEVEVQYVKPKRNTGRKRKVDYGLLVTAVVGLGLALLVVYLAQLAMH